MNNESVQIAAYCVIASRLPNNLRYPEENETTDNHHNNRSYRSLGTVKIEVKKPGLQNILFTNLILSS